MTERDRQRLVGCHPALVAKVDEIIDALPVFVVQGVRTLAMQQAEWEKGRLTPGPDASPLRPLGRVVTFCDGVLHPSNHQARADGFCYAVDLAFIPTAARPNPFDPQWPWQQLGDSAESKGLRWLGRTSLGDLDHVELPYVPPIEVNA